MAVQEIETMKHAYLILAHNEFGLLQRLVSEIDDSRNDIFIHIDRKVTELPEISAEMSELIFVEDRIDVRWGDWSVVEAEYSLFKEAVGHGPYQYYHLLSGVDRALKNQDYIHNFFDRNEGKEFIGFTYTGITPEVRRKAMRWHLFPKEFRDTPFLKRALRAVFLRIQEATGYLRNRDIAFAKGSQWVSITDDMARLFLENREWAEKTFTHTFCSDEMVIQTLCWNSPLKEKIFCTTDDGKGCMRAISWRNGVMTSWSEEDYTGLKKSEYLFARKFTSQK